VQKQTNILNQAEKHDVSAEGEAQNTLSSADADTSPSTDASAEISNDSQSQNTPDNKDLTDFEELIKGPYKDAFAKKVQSIINKRFKEQKVAESKSTADCKTDNTTSTHTEKEATADSDAKASDDSLYASLIEAGVDSETAYRVLHLDEIMDSSMRYGAELAAKQLTDSIRKKAARPFESALAQKGYSARSTASSLTPEKRKELAKKALMGEQIGF